MQDIHWSFGGVGYFPTYTLGNLYAAQFMDAVRRDVGADTLTAAFRAGDFTPLRSWLRERIHSQGRRFRAADLCRRATGQPLSPAPFLAYLSEKVSRLYDVC